MADYHQRLEQGLQDALDVVRDTKPNPTCVSCRHEVKGPAMDCGLRCEECDRNIRNSDGNGSEWKAMSLPVRPRVAPAVEPEPTSVGNAASDPHLASYCTNPDCVKIINHDGDCVVEPCEGCPDPELPCKGCPAVEPEQTLKGPQPNPRYATGGPEYVAWCEGHEAGWADAQQGKTTGSTCPACAFPANDYEPHIEGGFTCQVLAGRRQQERARIQRIIENHVKFCRMDGRDAAASEIEYLLAAIRGGDDA